MTLKAYHKEDESRVLAATQPVYHKKFREFPPETLLVAHTEDTLAGWMHVHVPESPLHSGFVFIYVAPGCRRRGVGTHLYREAEKRFLSRGCNWWSSYPPCPAADRFALAMGFDYTNTNLFMVHNSEPVPISEAGIRPCREADYPIPADIWAREYADMHLRIGLPYKKRERTPEEKRIQRDNFMQNIHNWFVLEEDAIVGMGCLFDDNSGIGALAVDKLHTGKGCGTRLAAYLTNESIRRGCKAPCLYCEAGNADALHVYHADRSLTLGTCFCYIYHKTRQINNLTARNVAIKFAEFSVYEGYFEGDFRGRR